LRIPRPTLFNFALSLSSSTPPFLTAAFIELILDLILLATLLNLLAKPLNLLAALMVY